MQDAKPGFYFALPRLVARVFGANDSRVETNWLEANVVGGFIFGLACVFLLHLLVPSRALCQQMLLLPPLAILAWLGSLVILYLNSLVLRVLRAFGLPRQVANDRVQGFLFGLVTTVFALALVRAESWCSYAGGIWLALFSLNLIAATVLSLLPPHGTAAT